jgi:asparaginyl-tRNA synthetase
MESDPLRARQGRRIFRPPCNRNTGSAMAAATEVRDLGSHVDREVEVTGWVQTTRSHGKIGFVVVRDGTGIVQCVVARQEVDAGTWEAFSGLAQETTVRVTGRVRPDQRAPGGHEITVTGLEVLFPVVDDYPIQPKEHGIEFLLDHRHLWIRSTQQRAGLRVRDELEMGIHQFFYDRGFVRIDTPILSGSIGESAGTLFETDYFGETAYLAQTGQLYVEAAAAAFRKVYCFGPTFRAEKSKTRRHLTEFWMVEPEVAFNDSDANMRLQEEFVSFLVERVVERCADELAILERDPRALEHVRPPFPRVSYTDAIAFLKERGHEIEWGSDLGAPDEAAISEQYNLPVFVYNYPKQAKAFYMKENPEDPRTVLCNDLLAPEGYGEIIGGSQREDDHDRLLARIREEGLPEEAYAWYLDLRRYGSFPHSGFGLGVERTIAWITGRRHIRELIAFPRMINRLTP